MLPSPHGRGAGGEVGVWWSFFVWLGLFVVCKGMAVRIRRRRIACAQSGAVFWRSVESGGNDVGDKDRKGWGEGE